MDKIIALVGESGSGKTTIAKELEKRGYNVIKSYTTRPPREPGEWGHTFVDRGNYGLDSGIFLNSFTYYHPCKIIACTFYNGYHYWATTWQYQGKGTSIYVVDPAGVKDLKNNIKDAEILVIYLKADQETRYARMLKRGTNSIKSRLEIVKDARQRLEHDESVFTCFSANYVIDANRGIEDVLEDIEGVIK
jgi:guanylate kinase